jgi:hypothetical protein
LYSFYLAHVAIALDIGGEMHICESNVKTEDWPVNGIQCNPYYQWIEWINKGNHSVVWTPLDPAIPFDKKSALSFF